MVGKNELGVFIWLQLNDALGLVDDVAITGFFSYHIGAGREHRQVDFSALVSPELLGAIGALHRFDLEYSVGDYLGGIVGIHLDEPQPGLHVVEEHQLLDAVAGVELHLLGRGVQNVPLIAGIHLKRPVSTRLCIGEQDFTKLIRLEIAQKFAVPINREGDIGHGDHIFSIILDDPQSR